MSLISFEAPVLVEPSFLGRCGSPRWLRKAVAPLDNKIAERALKRAIRHRKNALFDRTLHGAQVGDPDPNHEQHQELRLARL